MKFIKKQAEDAGKVPNDFACEMLKEKMGTDELGNILKKFGDPVEGLAFIMLQDLASKKTGS
jgi:hypothetical protein